MDIWSLILGLVGIGLAFISIFLPHMGVNMPQPIAWAGFSVGILFLLWAISIGFWGHEKIPVVPVLFFIVSFAVMIGSISSIKVAIISKTEKQTPSDIVNIFIGKFSHIKNKGFWTMEISFHNDSNKECAIKAVYMITADKTNLLKINGNDSIHNNYNNKLNKNSFILGPKSLTGARGLPKSFTKVLKPGELYPMEIKIPFESITDYFKVNSLKIVKKLPIGVTIDMINYKGQEVSAVIYPCAEIQFSEDGEISRASGANRSIDLKLEGSLTFY